nr:hypothetical protein [uncultured Campylobacter sp.]
MVNKNGTTPAHIVFSKKDSPTGVCAQVLASQPINDYFQAKIDGTNNGIAVGSSTSVYTKPTTNNSSSNGGAATVAPLNNK